MTYRLLEQVIAKGTAELADNEKEVDALISEVRAIRKKMIVLPTARENEALPEIILLRELSKALLSDYTTSFREIVFSNEKLEKLIFEELFDAVCHEIIKTRVYTNKEIVRTADALFNNLIAFSAIHLKLGKLTLVSLINRIIDKSADFYKTNGRDYHGSTLLFGEPVEQDDSLRKWIDKLERGSKIDCLKYFSGKKNWSRAIIESRDSGTIKVRFLGDFQECYVQNPSQEIAPAGSRETDFEWRESLNVGDLVDYYNFRYDWILARVIRLQIDSFTNQETVHSVDLQREIKSINGADEASIKPAGSNSMFSHDGGNQPFVVRVHSPVIMPPGKFSNKGYAQIDDSEDVIHLANEKKKRYAILRAGSSSGAGSVHIVRFLNTFGEYGGFEYLIAILKGTASMGPELLGQLVRIVQNASDNLVEPFVKANGEDILNSISFYIRDQAEKNLRSVSQAGLLSFLESYSSLAMRVFPLKKARSMSQGLIVSIGISCLKSDILEKQFFGAKQLLLVEAKTRDFEIEFSRADLAERLDKEGIFERIVKGHPSLISKGSGVLRLLVTEGKIYNSQLSLVWETILKTDTESRTALLSVLKEIIWDFSKDQIRFFTTIMLQNPEEINSEIFDLLVNFRKTGLGKFNDLEISNMVNQVLWEILQSDKDLKPELNKEVIQNFVNAIDEETAASYIVQIASQAGSATSSNRRRRLSLKLLDKIMKQKDSFCNLVVEALEKNQIVDICLNDVIAILSTRKANENGKVSEEQKQGDQLGSEDRDHLKVRLKLFTKLVKLKSFNHSSLFEFHHFQKIWDCIFVSGYLDDTLQSWLKEYISSESHSGPSEVWKSFFTSNISKFVNHGKSEFFKFLLFVVSEINIKEDKMMKLKVKVETDNYLTHKVNTKSVVVLISPTEHLFGLSSLWDLLISSTDKSLFVHVVNALIRIYLPSELCDNYDQQLYQSEKAKLATRAVELFLTGDRLKGHKASLILNRIVRLEERFCSGPIVSFAGLKEGHKTLIYFEKDSKFLRERGKVELLDNQTILELREAIAKEYNTSFEYIQLVRENGIEFIFAENAYTIESAGINSRDFFQVRDNEVLEIQEAPVLNDDGTDFSEQALKVLQEIFDEFSENGKMTKEHLSNFTSKATENSMSSVNDERVIQFFEKYDPERKGYCLVEDFIHFYKCAARLGDNKIRTIRQNLYSLGYGKDLKLKKDKQNHNTYNLGFSIRAHLFKNDTFNNQLWRFISEQSETTDGAIGQESFIQLAALLSPGKLNVLKIISDPIGEFHREDSLDALKFKAILLHALFQRSPQVISLCEFADIQFGDKVFEEFVLKLVSPLFLETLTALSLAHLNDEKPFYHGIAEVFFPFLRVLEHILKAVSSKNDSSFLADMRNFQTYFMKQKKKPVEKPQTDSASKQLKDAGTAPLPSLANVPETNLAPLFGPQEKDSNEKTEKDRNKEKEREEQEAKADESQNQKLQEIMAFHKNLSSFFSNLPLLNNFLVQMLTSMNKSNLTFYKAEKGSFRSALISLISSFKLNEEELSRLLLLDSFRRLLLNGLGSDRQFIRLHFKNFFCYLTENVSDLTTKIEFLRILISSLGGETTEELHSIIELACSVLGEIAEIKDQASDKSILLKSGLNFMQLFQDFSSKLLRHASQETSFDEKEDGLLIGYMTFMEKILRADESVLLELDQHFKGDLIGFIFKDCLFEVIKNGLAFSHIRCRSKRSRAAAMNLLVQLLKGDLKSTIRLLISGILPLSKVLPDLQTQSSGFLGEIDRRSNYGFLGLKNLGCVCYMIAMLQQFYCTPAFRYGLLMADDSKPVELSEVKGRMIDDNVFHQLQKMFAYQDQSERKDFSPLEFCLSYKDFSGQPTNVMVQQDADEFLKVLFDRLEEAMKGSPYMGVLHSVFQGRISNIITCKSCKSEKINEETFYNLSMEVKGMSNIKESMNKFIEEDTISDFFCDSCKKKSDISKRAMLTKLPNVLIMYLKKMVFDLELLVNTKIHSKYEFPTQLNLRPYVMSDLSPKIPGGIEEEGETGNQQDLKQLSDDDLEYKLVGVVIHRGNAEFGHYTSLINVNRGDPRRESMDSDLWLEFDDSRVTKFDMSHFNEECFGVNEEKDAFSGNMNFESTVSKSAYILIYDKIKKSPLTFEFDANNIASKEKVLSCFKDPSAVLLKGMLLETDFYNLKSIINPRYDAEIQRDNGALIMEQQLLSGSFTNSFADIFANVKYPVLFDQNSERTTGEEIASIFRSFAEVSLVTLPPFLFKIYCVSSENYKIGKIVKSIESALNYIYQYKYYNYSNAISLAIDRKLVLFFAENVHSNLRSIMSLITNSSDQFIKGPLVDFFVSSFISLINNFHITQFTKDSRMDPSPELPPHDRAEILVIQSLHALLSAFPGSEINPLTLRKLAGVFSIVEKLVDHSKIICNYIYQANFLHTVYELYMGIDCMKYTGVEKALSPLLSIIGSILGLLATQLSQPGENQSQTQNYYNFFVRPELFSKALREDYRFNNYEALRNIVSVTALDNPQLSDQLSYKCLKGLVSGSDSDAVGYLEVIRTLISLKDIYSVHRVQNIFGVPRLNELCSSELGAKTFVYGLCRDTLLKKSCVNYITPFGLERGLLEILFSSKDINETTALLLIYYILDLAESSKEVLSHIATTSPPSYLSATYYDWFKSYAEHHLKYMTSSYLSYRADMTSLYFNNLPEKIDTFEKKLREFIEKETENLPTDKKLFSDNTAVHSTYSSSWGKREDGTESKELFGINKSYIIGKTIRNLLLENIKLDETSFGELKIKFHLVTVALMTSHPTGGGNLSIPSSCVHEFSVFRSSGASEEFTRFLGKKEIIYSSSNTDFPDEEISDSKHANGHLLSTDQLEGKVSDMYQIVDYILRVSVSNHSSQSYFIKLSLYSDEKANFDEQELLFLSRGNKSNTLLQTVTLKDPSFTFSGLRAGVSFKKTSSQAINEYSEDDLSDFAEVFSFDERN